MRRRSGFGWMEFIEGLLLLGLGSYTFAQPDRALTGFIVMYGIVAVTMGIADILLYVRVERFTGFGPIVSRPAYGPPLGRGLYLLFHADHECAWPDPRRSDAGRSAGLVAVRPVSCQLLSGPARRGLHHSGLQQARLPRIECYA